MTKPIDVGSVLAAGRELELREAVTLPAFESYEFEAPAAVALDVRRVGAGLDLRGTVDVTVHGSCARCLDEVRFPVHLDVEERLEPRSAKDPLDENNVLSGNHLDLNDLVRQLIDAALPLTLVCTGDCGGLCAQCGQKRDGTCRCQAHLSE
ncbi:MAG TPA: DUF177 domain-containing protein [Candidatus Baltobacteraceae bacterium]|nr:DUF177 domain-containing protein [Candidatus Baltobacteraceae bacterium]